MWYDKRSLPKNPCANPGFTACYNKYADIVDIKKYCKVKSFRSFKKNVRLIANLKTIC